MFDWFSRQPSNYNKKILTLRTIKVACMSRPRENVTGLTQIPNQYTQLYLD